MFRIGRRRRTNGLPAGNRPDDFGPYHRCTRADRPGRYIRAKPNSRGLSAADRNFAKSRGSSRPAVTYNSQTAREHDRSREPSSTRSLNYAPFG